MAAEAEAAREARAKVGERSALGWDDLCFSSQRFFTENMFRLLPKLE